MDQAYDVLGFLSLSTNEAGDGYLGALLVTDGDGIPLEFRVTHPVKPTGIQRPLYGDALEPYIGVILCGRQLVKAAERRPELLFVNKDYLLDLRQELRMPVVHVREAGQAIEVGPDLSPRAQSRIESAGAFRPIVVSVHSVDAGNLDSLRTQLEQLAARMNLLEPFQRVVEAIKVLAKQDRRFQ